VPEFRVMEVNEEHGFPWTSWKEKETV